MTVTSTSRRYLPHAATPAGNDGHYGTCAACGWPVQLVFKGNRRQVGQAAQAVLMRDAVNWSWRHASNPESPMIPRPYRGRPQ